MQYFIDWKYQNHVCICFERLNKNNIAFLGYITRLKIISSQTKLSCGCAVVCINNLSIFETFCAGDNGSLWFWDWKSGHNFQQDQTIVQPGKF